MLTTSIIRGYPVLTVYDHSLLTSSKYIQRLNFRSVTPRELTDLSFYADRSSVTTVYAAPDPLQHLPRTEQGAVKLAYCIKLFSSQLRAIREALDDKPHRYVSEASLANLKTAPPFTTESRPDKPRKYSPELILQAIALKASGMSWANLARQFQCNLRGLESACRKFTALVT